MTLSKSCPDKSDLAVNVYQVIKIKTSNKLSEIYFSTILLLHQWPMLGSNQSLKLILMYFKPINRRNKKNQRRINIYQDNIALQKKKFKLVKFQEGNAISPPPPFHSS